MKDNRNGRNRSEQDDVRVLGEARKAMKTKLAAGRQVTMHTHAEEESGYLVSGHMILTIGGMDYELHTGDVWRIPAGVPHGAHVIEESVTIGLLQAVQGEQ